MGIESVWAEIYNEIQAHDESPNELTADELSELHERYAWEAEEVQHRAQLGLRTFNESLKMSASEVKELQRIIWAADDGIFWPLSFNAYLKYSGNNNDLALHDILASGSTTRSIDSESILASDIHIEYPPRTDEEKRSLQTTLQAYGLYTGEIDWIFWMNSKKALQNYLQIKWLYDWAIDGIIWSQSLLAINSVNWEDSIFQNERNKEYIASGYEKLEGYEQLSESWQKIYKEFFTVLRPHERQEVLNGKPFNLVDPNTKELIFVDWTDTYTMNVIIWQNGTTKWGYVSGDRKTPVWQIHRFNTVKFWSERNSRSILKEGEPYKPDLMPAWNGTWRNLYYNKEVQSYYWERLNYSSGEWVQDKRVTVVGLSIQSDLANSYGWRYYHLVWPNRRGTWWCVGIKYEDRDEGMRMARAIQNKWGFWYVSKA
jgi:hypothetical protein